MGHSLSPNLRPGPPDIWPPSPANSGPRSTGRLALGGVLGTTSGLGLAVLAYTALDRQDSCLASDCDSKLGSGLLPAAGGITSMNPPGVHLADSGRGSFLKGLIHSAGTAGLGWGDAALANDGRWLLLVPPLQIAAAVLAERSTAH